MNPHIIDSTPTQEPVELNLEYDSEKRKYFLLQTQAIEILKTLSVDSNVEWVVLVVLGCIPMGPLVANCLCICRDGEDATRWNNLLLNSEEEENYWPVYRNNKSPNFSVDGEAILEDLIALLVEKDEEEDYSLPILAIYHQTFDTQHSDVEFLGHIDFCIDDEYQLELKNMLHKKKGSSPKVKVEI